MTVPRDRADTAPLTNPINARPGSDFDDREFMDIITGDVGPTDWPRTEAGQRLRELLLGIFREVKRLVPDSIPIEDPRGLIAEVEREAAAPDAPAPPDCRDGHDERLTTDFDGDPIRCARCKAAPAPPDWCGIIGLFMGQEQYCGEPARSFWHQPGHESFQHEFVPLTLTPQRVAQPSAPQALDVERLADALVESGLMKRFLDYAIDAHKSTMSRKDTPADLALYWARPVAESYSRLPSEEER